MPKHEPGSAKAISNRMKSVGLQRLRWYCQMCEKQCRDENGFKCHLTSDSHLRQMRLFAENSGKFLNSFSEDFQNGFLNILSRRHGTKRVNANTVYQEYIADKNHVHMNATAWTTLAGFIKHLGKEGKCIADETEKGWFVQFIDRDPKLLAKQEQAELRQRSELSEEERIRRQIEAQIQAAEKRKLESGCTEEEEEQSHELRETNEEIKIDIGIAKVSAPAKKKLRTGMFSFGDDDDLSNVVVNSNGKQSAIEQLIAEDNEKKAAQITIDEVRDRREHWLHEQIDVKIMNKKIGDGKFYKQKGTIRKVIDDFLAEIVLSNGTVVRIDQDELETVIPKSGGIVMIVNGAARGCQAEVLRINEESFDCTVRVLTGKYAQQEISKKYEDISRMSRSE